MTSVIRPYHNFAPFFGQTGEWKAHAYADAIWTKSGIGRDWTKTGIADYCAQLDYRWYDGAIMMSRTQITLDHEMQRRVRRRASDLGVSLAEYFRRLVARDLARPEAASDVHLIFDLGNSGGSDIARAKDEMIGEAVHSSRKKRP